MHKGNQSYSQKPSDRLNQTSKKSISKGSGITLVTFMHWFLPLGMALAGGAMLFVISDEVIPETHHKTHSRLSTYALMIGFIVMMTLDNLFG